MTTLLRSTALPQPGADTSLLFLSPKHGAGPPMAPPLQSRQLPLRRHTLAAGVKDGTLLAKRAPAAYPQAGRRVVRENVFIGGGVGVGGAAVFQVFREGQVLLRR